MDPDLFAELTNGHLDKVKLLIAQHANIYKSTDSDESLLLFAIRLKHEEIANLILDIYERDLKIIKEYFAKKNIPQTFWTTQRILIASGYNHVQYVKSRSREMLVTNPDKQLFEQKKGLIILLKTAETTEILWLGPCKHGDDKRIAEIVEEIYEDGILKIGPSEFWESCKFQTAAEQNMPEILFRMFSIFYAEQYLTVRNYLDYFCTIAEFETNKVKKLKELIERYGKYNLCEDIDQIISDLLCSPILHKNFELFEYFLNKLANNKMIQLNVSHDKAAQNIIEELRCCHIRNYTAESINLMEMEFARISLKYKPNLLDAMTWEDCSLTTFIKFQKPTEAIVDYILSNFKQIQDKGFEQDAVQMLFEHNWIDVLRIMYTDYPSTRDILFKDTAIAMELLIASIMEGDFDVIYFAADMHAANFTSSTVAKLISTAVSMENSMKLIQFLLKMPELIPEDPIFKSAFLVALESHILSNYHILLSSNIGKRVNLQDATDELGNNILASAILKIEKNDCMITSTLSSEMDQIFDSLISVGIDFKNINKNNENLIHIAVARNNLNAVKKLLELGVDPNMVNKYGSTPIHYVESLEIYQELVKVLSTTALNTPNIDGETPLLSYVKRTSISETNEELLQLIIAACTNLNHIDNARNNALHLAQNVNTAKHLLCHGVDINAQNDIGKTPVHTSNTSIFKFLIIQPNINMLLTTNNGMSLLAFLIELSDDEIKEILPELLKRPDDIRQLFEKHCNTFDTSSFPILYTASQADTNDYCLQQLLEIEHLQWDINEDTECFNEDSMFPWLTAIGASKPARKNKDPLDFSTYKKTDKYRSYIEYMRVYLRSGADTEIRDNRGDTALVYVKRDMWTKETGLLMTALIKAGAKYRFTDSFGGKPLDGTIFQCLYDYDD